MNGETSAWWAASLVLALVGCQASEGAVPSARVVDLDRGAYTEIDEGRAKVLIVVAHPDDELVAAGLTYLHGAARGGIVDVVTITDGQGGFKYAALAEARTGVELTREVVGRRALPALRLDEQSRGLELLGARRLIWLDQPDHRYSQDRMEVLAEDAGVWDLGGIASALDALIARERYEFIVTLSPTATTHGHHQAAALLAIGAAARAPKETRPIVLACEVEGADDDDVGTPPAVLEDALLARLEPGAPPFTVDRARGHGHRDRVTLKAIAAVAVAQHLSQGTMLGFIGRGDLEEYWIFAVSPPDAVERCRAFFDELRAGPLFSERSYGDTAGTNASTGRPVGDKR